MSDFLVDLGPGARRIVKGLGLPIPLPQKLKRATDSWQPRPLDGTDIAVGTTEHSQLAGPIADAIGPFAAAGEGWGRPARPADEVDDLKASALVFDGSGLSEPGHLRAVYEFFKPRMRSLKRCGRIVVLGRPPTECDTVAAAATQRALEGFVRSLGKELGRRGATANLIRVAPGAEDRLEGPLHVTADVPVAASPHTRALDGKVALVTGAARGIGAATARALAREGAHVICLDRPEDDGPASLIASEVGGTLLRCDVTADDAPERIASLVREEFGHIDVIVHNAGVTRDKTLKNMDEARWDLTLDVNLGAVIRITEALDPLLAEGARIVCLSSIAGIAGNFGQTNYAASKAGVAGYVAAAGKAWAGRGIAVNAIAPGFIETRLTKAIPAATREVARRLSNLSQGGLPEDVAEVITFLSSPGGGALSGQVLRVCGGNFVGA